MDKEQVDKIQLCTNETILELVKQQKNTVNTYKNTMIALIISITVIIAAICGTVLYTINNMEVVEETTVTQETDGESEIINGNQYKDNATHNS